MIAQIKSAFARSSATLAQDLAGVVVLMVILVGSLHLPALI